MDGDDEPNCFQPLSLATARLVKRLSEQQTDHEKRSRRDGSRDSSQVERGEEFTDHVTTDPHLNSLCPERCESGRRGTLPRTRRPCLLEENAVKENSGLVSATQNVATAVSSARVDVSRSGWEEKAAFALQLGAGVAPGGTGVVEFSESCCGSKTEQRA
jgi:hypothetical protein